MINLFRRALDRSMFSWWLNLSNSSVLKIIGGDSNLPEKKMIIKSLQHHEIIMYMLEIKGDWVSQKDIEDITALIYKKFHPFINASSKSKTNIKFSRQSFLSLLAIYNICNIGINSKTLNPNKLKFKLCDELTRDELLLLSGVHAKLSQIFKRVFQDTSSSFVVELDDIKNPMSFMDNTLLTLMICSLIASIASFAILPSILYSLFFLAVSISIFAYFYSMRTKAITAAFERNIIQKLRKQRGV